MEIIGERKKNLDDQIQVLGVLNNFCSDNGQSKDLLSIQKRIRIQLFNIGTNPMKRGVIFFQSEGAFNIMESPPDNQRALASIVPVHIGSTILPPISKSTATVIPQHSLSPEQVDAKRKADLTQYTVKIFKPSNSSLE